MAFKYLVIIDNYRHERHFHGNIVPFTAAINVLGA